MKCDSVVQSKPGNRSGERPMLEFINWLTSGNTCIPSHKIFPPESMYSKLEFEVRNLPNRQLPRSKNVKSGKYFNPPSMFQLI